MTLHWISNIGPDMKKNILIFILIFSLGVALRLFAFSQVSAADKFTWTGGDEAHYYEVATNIYEGRWPVIDFIFQFWRRAGFGENDALWEPLFPFVLGGSFYIFGHSILTAKIIVLLLSVATLILAYFAGSMVYNKKTGLIVMFLLAIQPKHIEYSANIMKDTLYAFLFLLAFLLMVLSFRENKLASWTFFGIALALSFLTRYFTIVLVLVFLILLFTNRKKINWRFVGVSVLAFMIVLLPWAIYTYDVFGAPFFSVTKYYPYSLSGWKGMSYQGSAPVLEEYLKNSSVADIIKARLSLFPLVAYYLPIWFNPLIFLFFLVIFSLRDSYAISVKWYFIVLLIFYFVQFAAANLFLERAFFALIYVALVPIGYLISKLTEVSKVFRFDGKIFSAALICLILISSIALLCWKLNDIKNYNMQEKQEALEKLGYWVKASTNERDVIMTIFPADVHYYTERRTVMDPYNFALNIGVLDINNYRNRNREEAVLYNVTYVLLHTKDKNAEEGYAPFSLELVYSDEEAKLSLYRIKGIRV